MRLRRKVLLVTGGLVLRAIGAAAVVVGPRNIVGMLRYDIRDEAKVEGRAIDDEVRRSRIVMYRYYADGPEPCTRDAAKEACLKQSGDWVE